jgi:hypothetical protein
MSIPQRFCYRKPPVAMFIGIPIQGLELFLWWSWWNVVVKKGPFSTRGRILHPTHRANREKFAKSDPTEKLLFRPFLSRGRVRPQIFVPVLFCSFPHIFLSGQIIFVGSLIPSSVVEE